MDTPVQAADNIELENRLLREQIKAAQSRFERKIEEISLVRELGMGLLSFQDFQNACEFITDTIINNTVAQNCSIMLMDRDENRLFLASAADLENNTYTVPAKHIFTKEALQYSFKFGEGAAGRAMADKKPIVVQDTSHSHYFDSKHKSRVPIGSLLVVPLLVKNEPMGVLNLSHSASNAFSAEDINIFNIIANYVAISVQNTLYFEKLNLEVARRTQVENALRKAHENLELRIQERTAELAEANEHLKNEIMERKGAQAEALGAKFRAERANRAKSEFLANMSHELRTPMNHIIGFTELVIDGSFGDLNEQQREFLSSVLDSGRHLLSLINDILDLSKVEAGKLELELSEVNLPDLLTASLKMVKEKALKHGIQLGTSIDGIPETVRLDERKLKQILYNLLSNAAKFTPDGGRIELSARTVTGDVLFGKNWNEFSGIRLFDHVSEDDNGERAFINRYIELSVSDNGIGIEKEDQSRIFNAFEQVAGSDSHGYEGTGLGLSLTQKLVELHGGKIWVESEGENRGSTFRFIIPVCE